MPLGDLFSAGIAHFPDRIAIADRKTNLSFSELETLANGYAGYLADHHDVQPQDRVMVICRKRCQVPAIAVALWKIGAVYMPIDADLPPARIATIASSAAPKLIVTLETMSELHIPYVNLDKVELSRRPVGSRAHAPAEIAYIIHTSGSTGSPKGVQITVGNLHRYFCAHNTMLCFTAASRVISFTPFHFDVSIEDTLLPLSLGAFVYQYNGPPVGELMRHALRRERITHLIAVSTVLTIICDQPGHITAEAFPQLEMIMTGAEVCAPSVINLWAARLPDARVYNVYGPTEVTIVCMGYRIRVPDSNRTQPYPIGTPLDGVEVLLLDTDGREIAAAGEAGELCLGGAQVMAGYLGAPEQTSRSIFERDGLRYYRSGDRCRRDDEGNFHFVGRVDAEVKLNGRRINLAEIEAECMAVSAVSRAAIGLIQAPSGRKVIGAVLITDDPQAVHAVRQRLLMQLPTYMLPTLWGLGSEVRLRSSGKTDERVLLSVLENEARRDATATVVDIV